MNVVHLTASTFFGGPERQMLGLARHLPAPFDSAFLSFREGGRCEAFLDQVRRAGFVGQPLAHDTPQLGRCIGEVADRLRLLRADILVTHGYKSNLLGRPAARRAGIPIVSVSRGWTGENLKVRFYESLDRFHLRYMDRVVCVSQAQADRVYRTDAPPGRVRIIRNAARLEAFAEPDPTGFRTLRSLAGGDGPIVLAAGRLSPEKGFATLIRAARWVVQSITSARFILFGQGPERESLEKLIQDLHLEAHVRLPGHRSELDALLPWANVVVLPSLTEGLPNVALEASAAGLPVVATAVGGTPEVVADGRTGYLVPPGVPEQMGRRIVELLESPRLAGQMGLAGRRKMTAEFSFHSQAEAYRNLFEELTPAAARRREPAWA